MNIVWLYHYENIASHTAHTIVSLPNTKQWLMIHISDRFDDDDELMCIYSHYQKIDGWAENTQHHILHKM